MTSELATFAGGVGVWSSSLYYINEASELVTYSFENIRAAAQVIDTGVENILVEETGVLVLRTSGVLEKPDAVVNLQQVASPEYWCALARVGETYLVSGWSESKKTRTYILLSSTLKIIQRHSLPNGEHSSLSLKETGQ